MKRMEVTPGEMQRGGQACLVLRCCPGSHELWVAGVCQVIAVDLCLVHLKALLPETAFQFALELC